MQEVVANEGGEAIDDKITFPELKQMELMDLSNFTSFSSGNHIFSFPSLKEMTAKDCPKMKIFSPSPVTTPKLKGVKVGYFKWRWQWQDDLNTTIQGLFTKAHGMY